MSESKVTRPESLATRVRRGVALLDEKVPGWHNRIDVDELDLRFCTTCIVGQLFGPGSFWGPLRTLTGLKVVGYDESRGYGFDVDPFEHDHKALKRLWSYVVRRRQQTVFYVHREECGVDLAYMVTAAGDTWCWSEKYGWRRSQFKNLNDCDAGSRAHFTDHLVAVSVEQLPVGAR